MGTLLDDPPRHRRSQKGFDRVLDKTLGPSHLRPRSGSRPVVDWGGDGLGTGKVTASRGPFITLSLASPTSNDLESRSSKEVLLQY